VEAVEWADDGQWLVAVQYHPEDLHAAEPAHLRLFTTFLDRAGERARDRDVRRGTDERKLCTT
jgi:gamma-glutamyl-gamma-aminobutyrate hydrolase PuuD